jgi:hypothetical protein
MTGSTLNYMNKAEESSASLNKRPFDFFYLVDNTYGAKNDPISATLTVGSIVAKKASSVDVDRKAVLSQPFKDIVIQFTAKTPKDGKDNLLTVKGTGMIGAFEGNDIGVFLGDTMSKDALQFTSDFLRFVPDTRRAFQINLTNVMPRFRLSQNGYLASFSANATKDTGVVGRFSADVAKIPEPSALSLFAVGAFTLIMALRATGRSRGEGK